MGSSNDGPDQTPDASDSQAEAASSSNEGAGRGFFGRIISAFSPGGADAAETREQRAALSGLAALQRLSVDDVAIPKAEIIAVPVTAELSELVAVFRAHGFSRLPVYDDSLDQPLGLVLLKDIALNHGFDQTKPYDLKALLRPILYAPPSMPGAVLLQKMQKDRVHMALIIDEYGGVDGLVTIEDLIETVIGEIEDEHDEVAGHLWKEEAPGVLLAQSTAELEDLETALNFRLRSGAEDEEIDTIGGLVFLRTGHVPSKGEVIALENGATIEVVDADVRRIKRLRLRLPGQTGAEAMTGLAG